MRIRRLIERDGENNQKQISLRYAFLSPILDVISHRVYIVLFKVVTRHENSMSQIEQLKSDIWALVQKSGLSKLLLQSQYYLVIEPKICEPD